MGTVQGVGAGHAGPCGGSGAPLLGGARHRAPNAPRLLPPARAQADRARQRLNFLLRQAEIFQHFVPATKDAKKAEASKK